MARNPTWTRDELLLALDLYLEEGQLDPSSRHVRELSAVLQKLWVASLPVDAASLRSPASVALKLGNFAALDPDYPGQGMSHGGRGDRAVWDEYSRDRARLSRLAASIRATIIDHPELTLPALDDASAPEGAVLYRLHKARERDPRIVRRKKDQTLALTGHLACEVCAFDFAATYGSVGQGYIEAHHKVPLSLAPARVTKLSDLVLVCANCHRMLHWGARWPSVAELLEALGQDAGDESR
jgi:5-methylcytosine-specific restriction protein A